MKMKIRAHTLSKGRSTLVASCDSQLEASQWYYWRF